MQLPQQPSRRLAINPAINDRLHYHRKRRLKDDPKEMEFIVRGENFRPNVTVVASTDGGGVSTNLKTLFVSPEELRAWLPKSMWRTYHLSFRFVVRTKTGESAVEVQAPE